MCSAAVWETAGQQHRLLRRLSGCCVDELSSFAKLRFDRGAINDDAPFMVGRW
ncbi:hypothetical protein RMSM_06548 [Rhodopirellula maiorica SM1]|uniref:Uncharacterized protein n=1 Tax=Rhodopirellula maiorica SM1 TaxID=1265738 RepID=M5RMB8_9BACT|nr:hypothetical protein RMSM_06548 [Rhodopirellula maiorica SM1]